MPCAFGEPHDMQPCSQPYEDWLEELVKEFEAEHGYKVSAYMCAVCDYLGFTERDEDDEEDEPDDERQGT